MIFIPLIILPSRVRGSIGHRFVICLHSLHALLGEKARGDLVLAGLEDERKAAQDVMQPSVPATHLVLLSGRLKKMALQKFGSQEVERPFARLWRLWLRNLIDIHCIIRGF